jgi:ABC-type branched-subunit amino acid transport system substrate-binding protein
VRSRLWLLLAVALAGCGARVSDDQQRAAFAATGGGAPAGSAATSSGASPVGEGGAAAVEPGATDDGSGTSSTPTSTAVTAPAASTARRTATDVGVTADSIRIGNVSTFSGPVPGLFRGAVVGTQAAVAQRNSLGGIHGRRIELDVRDDQFDSAQNRAITTDLLDEVFAFAGSFAVYDDGGAEEVGRSGIPDVSPALSGARRRLPNNYNVAPAEDGGTQLAPYTYYSRVFPNALDAVGTLWGDVPISRASQMANEAAGRSVGWRFVYSRGYAATETDFTADVVRMRQLGVKLVFLAGSEPKTLARIAKAMRQQGFDVPIATMNIGYDASLLTLAPDALEGSYTTMAWAMFAGEDAERVPSVRVLNQWVQKVKPGHALDLYTLLGWSSAQLLFRAMEAVGPNLTRAAVNEALRTGGSFDADQLLAPADPGRKAPPTCIVAVQLRRGRYERVDTPPTGFRCDLGGYFRSRS